MYNPAHNSCVHCFVSCVVKFDSLGTLGKCGNLEQRESMKSVHFLKELLKNCSKHPWVKAASAFSRTPSFIMLMALIFGLTKARKGL